MLKKIGLSVAMALASLAGAYAAIPLKGRVVDSNGDPLPAVVVLEESVPSNGSLTDENGNFSIEVSSQDAELIFSMMGYLELREPVGARRTFNVTLKDDTTLLDEVVVVGYGVQKKGSLTASIASINTEKLAAAPTDNVSTMLGGKLPGLVSRQTSGLPGENDSQIYIRGISTTGSSTPLVLVDGVERDFSNLDPSEIADITILKDAASAAVYGVKGANGVILVTTRRGDVARTSVTYNGALSISTNADMLQLLDGVEYARWHNLAKTLDGLVPDYSDEQIGHIAANDDPQGILGSTDYLGLIFKKAAIGHNHNVTLTGGSKNVRYFIGGSVLNQDGIIDNVWFKRYNLRSNIDVNLTDNLTVKLDVSGRLEDRHQSGVSAGASDPTASLDNGGAEYGYKNVVFYAITARPTTRPMTPEGQYIGYQNPLVARDCSGFQQKDNSYVQTSLTLEYRVPFVKGLTLKAMGSYDFQNTLIKKMMLPCDQVTPQYSSLSSVLTLTPGNSPHLPSGVNNLTESHQLFTRYTFTAQANYSGSRGLHDYGADLVWEQSGTTSRYFAAGKQNFAITEIPDLNFSTEVAPNSVAGNHANTGRQGLLARGNYTYDNKYIVSASVRMDWSAKFAPARRLGIFPAVSLGWRISGEDFMAPARDVISDLKLRASWGVLGNDSISDFLYIQGVSLSTTPVATLNGKPVQGISTTSIPNAGITWETTTTWNAGLDATLWEGLLSIEADAFYKLTSGILQSQAGQNPPSIGSNFAAIVNSGRVDVRGFELQIGHANRIGDLSYSVAGNMSYAKNKYLSINDSDNIPAYQSKLGRSIGEVLGYVSDGLYRSEEDIASSPKTSSGVRVGDIKYKDLNGDGKISSEDRTWIAGAQIPEIMFGLNFDASWRGFDIALFFQGAANSDIMLCGTYSALGFSDGTYYTQTFKWGSNPPRYLVEGSWTPDHTDAQYPRLSTQSSSNNVVPSDFWRRDASYLRLKNAQIGYTLPKKVTRKFYVENLRVYASGSNLFTLSALSALGIDPEAPSVNNGYYPQQRVFNIGVSITF